MAAEQYAGNPDREQDRADDADDRLIEAEPARGGLRKRAVVQRRQKHRHETEQVEMRVRRRQREVLPDADENAEGHANEANRNADAKKRFDHDVLKSLVVLRNGAQLPAK